MGGSLPLTNPMRLRVLKTARKDSVWVLLHQLEERRQDDQRDRQRCPPAIRSQVAQEAHHQATVVGAGQGLFFEEIGGGLFHVPTISHRSMNNHEERCPEGRLRSSIDPVQLIGRIRNIWTHPVIGHGIHAQAPLERMRIQDLTPSRPKLRRPTRRHVWRRSQLEAIAL